MGVTYLDFPTVYILFPIVLCFRLKIAFRDIVIEEGPRRFVIYPLSGADNARMPISVIPPAVQTRFQKCGQIAFPAPDFFLLTSFHRRKTTVIAAEVLPRRDEKGIPVLEDALAGTLDSDDIFLQT